MSARITNPPIHLSHATLLMPVIDYLQNRGISVEDHLQEAGIAPILLEEKTTPLSTRMIYRFINRICETAGIEDIGLRVGRVTSLQMMGEFGQWMLDTDTIHNYLIRGCAQINRVSSVDYYWLLEEPDHMRFCASVPGLDEQDRVQDQLYLLLITINTIGQILGRTWQPPEIVIPAMSARTASKLAESLPESQILRQGKYASFLIPKELLDCPIAEASGPLPDLDFSLSGDYLSSVLQIIKVLVLAGKPTIQDAADAVGTSPRTLQRTLTRLGTSFTQRVVDARIELAKEYLLARDRSITEIAKNLGYSDTSNFSRAFRRATGTSPRAYRKSQA